MLKKTGCKMMPVETSTRDRLTPVVRANRCGTVREQSAKRSLR